MIAAFPRREERCQFLYRLEVLVARNVCGSDTDKKSKRKHSTLGQFVFFFRWHRRLPAGYSVGLGRDMQVLLLVKLFVIFMTNSELSRVAVAVLEEKYFLEISCGQPRSSQISRVHLAGSLQESNRCIASSVDIPPATRDTVRTFDIAPPVDIVQTLFFWTTAVLMTPITASLEMSRSDLWIVLLFWHVAS